MSRIDYRSERGVTLVETAALVSLILMVAAIGISSLGIMVQKPYCDATVPMQADFLQLSYDQHLQYSGGSGFRADEVRGDGKQGQCRIMAGANPLASVRLWNPVAPPNFQ